MSKRLTAAERQGFAAYARGMEDYLGRGGRGQRQTPTEPCLGSLDQRLAIIIKRQGGRLTAPRPTEEELASVERYEVDDQDLLL